MVARRKVCDFSRRLCRHRRTRTVRPSAAIRHVQQRDHRLHGFGAADGRGPIPGIDGGMLPLQVERHHRPGGCGGERLRHIGQTHARFDVEHIVLLSNPLEVPLQIPNTGWATLRRPLENRSIPVLYRHLLNEVLFAEDERSGRSYQKSSFRFLRPGTSNEISCSSNARMLPSYKACLLEVVYEVKDRAYLIYPPMNIWFAWIVSEQVSL